MDSHGDGQSEGPTLEFCRSLPKVELHAHLNGSISGETMRLLLGQKAEKLRSKGKADMIPEIWRTVMRKEGEELDSAFEKFQVIHSIVDCQEAVITATCDVVKEFADDNVQYLELRTTPRANKESGMNKKMYVDAVLRGIQQAIPLCKDVMDVRLLLSIDRRQSIGEAYDTVKLAHEYSTGQQGKVVGIDLSGDPKAGNVRNIVSVLEKAKHEGFKLSLHIAERPDQDQDSELLLMVSPDRLGHATYLHSGPKGELAFSVQSVLKKRIPIEICLTSNIQARTVASYDEHHLKFWMKNEHPVALCTDDKGVFSTTLSEEYNIAGSTFQLSKEYLSEMSELAMKYIFDT